MAPIEEFLTYRHASTDHNDDTPPTSPQQVDRVSTYLEGLEPQPCPRQPIAADADIAEMCNLNLNRLQDTPVRKQPNFVRPEQSIPTLTHYGVLQQWALVGPSNNPSKAGLPRGRRLGYDPQELLDSAISCQPCRLSDLRYAPKMSICRPEKFQDVPDYIFKVLEPALALAERMILQGNARFWMDMACGRRVVDRAKSECLGGRVERLLPADYCDATMASTADKLQRLGERIIFRFDSLENAYGMCGCRAFVPAIPANNSRYLQRGELLSSNTSSSSVLPNTDVWNDSVVVRFASELYAVAEKFAKLRTPDIASQLRFNFFFASNFCHEIAHAFENQCGNAYYAEEISQDRKGAAREGIIAPHYQSRFTEALYKNYPNEMGVAWEYDTFGGRLEPINTDKEIRYGLHVCLAGARSTPWSGSRSAMAGLSAYGWALPMAYIEELQQTSFWDNTINEYGLLVPRYGPETYLMSTTTTYTWRQHLLDLDPLHQSTKRTADLITDLRDALPEPLSKRRMTDSQPASKRRSATRRPTKANESRLSRTSRGRIASLSAGQAGFRFPTLASTSPNEKTIQDHAGFVYVQSEDHDQSCLRSERASKPPTYDLLSKPASELTAADKWLLCEEWAALARDWPSHKFLSWRSLYLSYPPATGIFNDFPRGLIPGSGTDNWDERTMQMLRELRLRVPERSLNARKERQDLERKARMKKWRTLAEMEEYIALKGLSRILFMHRFAANKPLGFGMTLDNWEQEYKPLLFLERGRRKQSGLRGTEGPSLLNVTTANKDESNEIKTCFAEGQSGQDDPMVKMSAIGRDWRQNPNTVFALSKEEVCQVATNVPAIEDEEEWKQWLTDPDL